MARRNDVEIVGLSRVMRALRDFPPEAQAELRDEAQRIATHTMLPAYQSAARAIPSWGSAMAGGIRAKRDRIPSVNIGYRRPKIAGGADTIMLRNPTHSGKARRSPAPFTATSWMDRAKGYKSKAMDEWGDALTRVVFKWNRGF